MNIRYIPLSEFETLLKRLQSYEADMSALLAILAEPPRPVGRPPLFGRAMTDHERYRLRKARKKLEQNK